MFYWVSYRVYTHLIVRVNTPCLSFSHSARHSQIIYNYSSSSFFSSSSTFSSSSALSFFIYSSFNLLHLLHHIITLSMLSPKTKCLTPVNRPASNRSSIDSSLSVLSSSSIATTPVFRNISTISNELRIGRLGTSIPNNNYMSSPSDTARYIVNRSPSLSNRRYSFPDQQPQNPGSGLFSAPSPSPSSAGSDQVMNLRKMSNEQIIDLMEREQDGIVLKLMKEIELLKDENKNLKVALSNALQLSSLTSRRTSSISSNDFGISTRLSLISNTSNSNFMSDRDESFDRKKIKRKLSNDLQRKSVTEYNLIEKNQLLQEEIKTLKSLLRKK